MPFVLLASIVEEGNGKSLVLLEYQLRLGDDCWQLKLENTQLQSWGDCGCRADSVGDGKLGAEKMHKGSNSVNQFIHQHY